MLLATTSSSALTVLRVTLRSGTVLVADSSALMVPQVFVDGLDASTQSVAFDSRDESLDTYVFEATAANNGVDTHQQRQCNERRNRRRT
jgi:hypothetical protein